jgi:hypothetical protein
VTLASAPIDAAWHAAFGRDAVLWSPPHLLGVFGTLVLLVGMLAGTRPGTRPWLPAAAGALLLGSAVVPVLEFETECRSSPRRCTCPSCWPGRCLPPPCCGWWCRARCRPIALDMERTGLR